MLRKKKVFQIFLGLLEYQKKGSKNIEKIIYRRVARKKSTILHQTPLITFFLLTLYMFDDFRVEERKSWDFYIFTNNENSKCIFPFKPARSSQNPGRKALAVCSNPHSPNPVLP